jgi:hypothetical protein
MFTAQKIPGAEELIKKAFNAPVQVEATPKIHIPQEPEEEGRFQRLSLLLENFKLFKS